MVTKYKEGIMKLEQRPTIDLVSLLLPTMPTMDFKVRGIPTIMDEETAMRKVSPSSNEFGNFRENYRGLLANILGFIWDKFNLPRERVIEYGSGPVGYYWSNLRPSGIEDWLQVELNPQSVALNRKNNPKAKIREGSFYDIGFRDVPLITGLSSLDCVANIPQAVSQIAGALQNGTGISRGGYILHIQDVNPGPSGFFNYLISEGITRPKTIVSSHQMVDGKGLPHFYAFKFGSSVITSIDLFRVALGSAISRDTRLNLLLNDYLTYSVPIKENFREVNFFGLRGALGPEQYGRRDVTTLVTLAQRIN